MSEMKARARSTDPATSHEAAANVELLGKAGSQRRKVYDFVVAHPGKTSGEIAASLGIDRYTPSRRLPELRDGGLVETGAERLCEVQGSKCLTWYPAKPAETRQEELFR